MILLSLFTNAQVKKISITQVSNLQRPSSSALFTGQHGGRFSINQSLHSQHQGYVKGLKSYKVFPNPSDGIVKLQGKALPSFVLIYNSQGFIVDKIIVKLFDAENAEIVIKGLPSGLYIIQSEGFTPQRLQLN